MEKILRVGMPNPYPPSIMECGVRNMQLTPSDECRKPGYYAFNGFHKILFNFEFILISGIVLETFDYIMQKAKLKYVMISLGNITGYGSLTENNTWTGYLGELAKVYHLVIFQIQAFNN